MPSLLVKMTITLISLQELLRFVRKIASEVSVKLNITVPYELTNDASNSFCL